MNTFKAPITIPSLIKHYFTIVLLTQVLIACDHINSEDRPPKKPETNYDNSKYEEFKKKELHNAVVNERKYGINFNKKRVELNIPIIDSLYKYDPDQSSWSYGDFENYPNGYHCKKIFCSDTVITSETDVYFSGFYEEEEPYTGFEWGAEPRMKFYEQVRVTYFYDTSRYNADSVIGSKQWICATGHFEQTIHHYLTDTYPQISLEQADSILKEWEIDRFNFTQSTNSSWD